MSTAIVRHDTISSLDDVQRVARLLAASNYFDAKGTGEQAIAQIATKILAGREMGYGPFASVQGIHVIQGKPVISANLMAAAVKHSGRYDYRVRRLDNDGCEIEFFQRNGDKWDSIGKSAFTKEDAKAAGLAGKDNWSKFARNMYFARALSNGIRWYAPDIFDGSAAYTPDELGVPEDADGNVIAVTGTIGEDVPPQNGTATGPDADAGATPAPYTGADVFKVRYPAAKDAARKAGKFTGEKHLENAWAKLFKEYGAHDPANADAFLAAFEAYVEVHEQEGVPSVADSVEVPV